MSNTRVVGQHGEFELIERIGAGGEAEVWKAHWLGRGQVVAARIMRVSGDPGRLSEDSARFLRGAVSGNVDHPNIVKTYDWGRCEDGAPFLILEYVDGPSLDDVLRQQSSLPEEDALRIARDITMALCHAEVKQIVYRDMKPSNILLTRDGTAKLTDFGLAKPRGTAGLLPAQSQPSAAAGRRPITVPGAIPGTLEYLSPEQIKGESLNTRTDIYSLGVTLFEMVTGRRPFCVDRSLPPDRQTPELMKRILDDRPPRPKSLAASLSDSTETLILTMLAKDPRNRYPTANALLDAIDAILAGFDRLHGGSIMGRLFAALQDPVLTRRAVVAAEVIGPPMALRKPRR